MLNIKIKIIEKKYDKEYNMTHIYVKAIVNGVEKKYSFNKFDDDVSDIPDALVFAEVLKLIKFDLEKPKL